MNYTIFKLDFQNAVHFGTGGLTVTGQTLMADTLFSALCCEAVRFGEDRLMQFVDMAGGGQILLSDALPFISGRYYVPRPILEIRSEREGDSSLKKALKSLSYIPVDEFGHFLKGTMDIEREAEFFHSNFGKEVLMEKAAIPADDQTRPYSVGLFRYGLESCLYVCLGYRSEEVYDLFCDLIDSLSYRGIGGELSAGYGRFVAKPARLPRELADRLRSSNVKKYMTLSVSLPADEELEQALEGADYRIAKRSGWVSSYTYADSFRKRRDFYMIAAGSVFTHKFRGDVFNIARAGDGKHPVYRYGRPMFMGVH